MEPSEERKTREPAETRAAGATAHRDALCARLDAGWVGRSVQLAGWVHRRRDLGGVYFVDLRDRSGLLQVAFASDWSDDEALETAADLKPEDVVLVAGEVARRPDEAVNPAMETGEIELHATSLRRVDEADELPILVAVPPEESLPSEELRLRHRTLDLRRPEMMRNFRVRHRAVAGAREALDEQGFLEVETPLLTRRTPEGARDYLVPSRLHPGEFYALPQSPQIYKQLLMASGFDRYYQVARCLRDEDLRADRQPEFTQVDVEMSFVAEDDVLAVGERMLDRMWLRGTGEGLATPFPRMTWEEARERFGTDSPDLRIPWELRDFTDVLTGLGFRIFDSVPEAGGRVRGVVARGGAGLSRSQRDDLDELAREHGAKGVLWLERSDGAWSGPPADSLDAEAEAALLEEHGVEEGDLVLLVAGPDAETAGPLDALRRRAARWLGALDRSADRWVWITEYPLFEEDPETGGPVPTHHPFTLPRAEDPDRVVEEPMDVKAYAYDVVYNGTEVCSGSLRCHRAPMQRAVFEALGMSEAEVEERFGFLLEAFRYGVPPHGGFALGVDRTVALMVGAPSIREVIAFPKTTAARGLLEQAPSPVEPDELDELGLRLAGGATEKEER